MCDRIREEVKAFRREVRDMVVDKGLEVLQQSDEEVLVRLGQSLLLKFLREDGRVFISVGSQDRPDALVAIEYVAKLLQWIENEEWVKFQRLEDEYIHTKNEQAEPPQPILPPHKLLDLAVETIGDLERRFSRENFDGTCGELSDIVEDYLKPACQEFSGGTRAERIRSY